MKGYEYQSDFAKLYVAEGRAKGREEGLIDGLIKGLTEGLSRGRTEGLTEGRTRGRAEGRSEGLFEGRTKEAARAMLTVLRVRGLEVPDSVRERIMAQPDPERLERWLEKAAVASSVTEVFDEPSAAFPIDSEPE